jgi:hypothetical protein
MTRAEDILNFLALNFLASSGKLPLKMEYGVVFSRT